MYRWYSPLKMWLTPRCRSDYWDTLTDYRIEDPRLNVSWSHQDLSIRPHLTKSDNKDEDVLFRLRIMMSQQHGHGNFIPERKATQNMTAPDQSDLAGSSENGSAILYIHEFTVPSNGGMEWNGPGRILKTAHLYHAWQLQVDMEIDVFDPIDPRPAQAEGNWSGKVRALRLGASILQTAGISRPFAFIRLARADPIAGAMDPDGKETLHGSGRFCLAGATFEPMVSDQHPSTSVGWMLWKMVLSLFRLDPDSGERKSAHYPIWRTSWQLSEWYQSFLRIGFRAFGAATWADRDLSLWWEESLDICAEYLAEIPQTWS